MMGGAPSGHPLFGLAKWPEPWDLGGLGVQCSLPGQCLGEPRKLRASTTQQLELLDLANKTRNTKLHVNLGWRRSTLREHVSVPQTVFIVHLKFSPAGRGVMVKTFLPQP